MYFIYTHKRVWMGTLKLSTIVTFVEWGCEQWKGFATYALWKIHCLNF